MVRTVTMLAGWQCACDEAAVEPTTRLRHADIAALWTTGENRQTKRMIDQRPKNREKLKERERDR